MPMIHSVRCKHAGISEHAGTKLFKAQRTGGQSSQQLDLTPTRLPSLKDTISHGDADRTTLILRQAVHDGVPRPRGMATVRTTHRFKFALKNRDGHPWL